MFVYDLKFPSSGVAGATGEYALNCCVAVFGSAFSGFASF